MTTYDDFTPLSDELLTILRDSPDPAVKARAESAIALRTAPVEELPPRRFTFVLGSTNINGFEITGVVLAPTEEKARAILENELKLQETCGDLQLYEAMTFDPRVEHLVYFIESKALDVVCKGVATLR